VQKLLVVEARTRERARSLALPFIPIAILPAAMHKPGNDNAYRSDTGKRPSSATAKTSAHRMRTGLKIPLFQKRISVYCTATPFR
jgi:hypothetical protein